jgi:hypothetical protein
MRIERNTVRRRVFLSITVVGMAVIVLVPAHALRMQVPLPEIVASRISTTEAAGKTPTPFRIGETLKYDVAWAAFPSAATVQLSIPEHREILGSRTWHFRASAHTLAPLRSFLTVDDQIDSYADIATFESRQYETYLDEMGKRESQILHFSVLGQPRRAGVPEVVISPGTLDPLGALYVLRRVDWQRTPEFRAPVFEGDDIVEMRAHLEVANEMVAVNAGNFSVKRVSVREYKGGVEVKQEGLTIFIANDVSSTPVLLEAEIPLGTVRIELSSR